MGFWNRWPYTNFHEINLDWILDKVKQVYSAMSDFAAVWTRKLDEETQARIDADEALNARVDQEIKDRTEADEAEAAARQEADEQLQENIDAEQQRAEAAEKALDDKITAETERATAKENDLQQQITAEVNRATGAENTLAQKITAETSRATAREDELEGMIQTETERATAAEEALGERIDGIEGELDGIAGADSPFIRKDGSTTTTGKIPLAQGGTSETDPAAETDLVNLRSMQAADEAIQQAMTEYVDNQLEVAMGDVHGIPAGGTTGQVLGKSSDADYAMQWIDPPSGSDPDAIKKDGTTVTTARIPFAEGIGLDSDNYWTENDFVSFTSGDNGGYTQIQNSNGNVAALYATGPNGGPILNGVRVEPNGLQIMANGSNGTSGQVLTAKGNGTCGWADGTSTDFEYVTTAEFEYTEGWGVTSATAKRVKIYKKDNLYIFKMDSSASFASINVPANSMKGFFIRLETTEWSFPPTANPSACAVISKSLNENITVVANSWIYLNNSATAFEISGVVSNNTSDSAPYYSIQSKGETVVGFAID